MDVPRQKKCLQSPLSVRADTLTWLPGGLSIIISHSLAGAAFGKPDSCPAARKSRDLPGHSDPSASSAGFSSRTRQIFRTFRLTVTRPSPPKPMQLTWTTSVSAGALHTARAILAGGAMIDRPLASELAAPAAALAEALAVAGCPPDTLWQHLLPLAASGTPARTWPQRCSLEVEIVAPPAIVGAAWPGYRRVRSGPPRGSSAGRRRIATATRALAQPVGSARTGFAFGSSSL